MGNYQLLKKNGTLRIKLVRLVFLLFFVCLKWRILIIWRNINFGWTEFETHSSGTELSTVVGCCEHSKSPGGTTKRWAFSDCVTASITRRILLNEVRYWELLLFHSNKRSVTSAWTRFLNVSSECTPLCPDTKHTENKIQGVLRIAYRIVWVSETRLIFILVQQRGKGQLLIILVD